MPAPRRKKIRIAQAIIILSRNYSTVRVKRGLPSEEFDLVDFDWPSLSTAQQGALDAMTASLPAVQDKTDLEIAPLTSGSALLAWDTNKIDSFEFVQTNSDDTAILVEVDESEVDSQALGAVNDAAVAFD